MFRVAHAPEGLPRFFDVVTVLDVPAWRAGEEEDKGEDDGRDEELENDNHFPVPFAEVLVVLLRCVADPVCNEGADRVEHLPEGHDLAANFWWSEFSNVDRSSGQCNTLPETDQDTAADKGRNAASRSERLHEGRDDDENTADGHAYLAACKVCDWTTEKESAYDGTHSVGGVDAADCFRALSLC